MADSLQQKTFSGMVWTFAKQFSLEGFGFIQGIILARLLVPKDYGLIAMTTIFFAISGAFIDSGFSLALMRKKDRKEIDYSTVFVTNVVLTFFFAIVLFSCAPLIANFYNEPILRNIVRANAILLVLNSVNAVQGTRLAINLQFKISSFISVVCTIIIGIATIILAYLGFGVWSLIYPNFLNPILKYFLFWYYQRWRPKINFSWTIWKEYFSFGSKLLLSSLLNTIFSNLYPLIIGKKYSATDLGYYSKASGYAGLPVKTFQGVIGSVTFPVLSSIQDDDTRLKNAYRRLIKLTGYIVFPLLMGLAALAKPFILVLVREKWAASIPYLVVICFSTMWLPLHILNLNLLQIKGRSDMFLRLEVFKKMVSLVVISITLNFSVMAICVGNVITSLLCLYINTYYTGRLIDVGYIQQMKDLLPSFVLAVSMGLLVYVSTLLIPNLILQIIVGVVLGMVYYLFVSFLFKSSELAYVRILLRDNVIKRYVKK